MVVLIRLFLLDQELSKWKLIYLWKERERESWDMPLTCNPEETGSRNMNWFLKLKAESVTLSQLERCRLGTSCLKIPFKRLPLQLMLELSRLECNAPGCWMGLLASAPAVSLLSRWRGRDRVWQTLPSLHLGMPLQHSPATFLTPPCCLGLSWSLLAASRAPTTGSIGQCKPQC